MTTQQPQKQKKHLSKKRSRGKQIAAIVCIALLVALYIGTLLAAILDFPNSGRLFQACLAATVGVPILLWIYMWIYKYVMQNKEPHEDDE